MFSQLIFWVRHLKSCFQNTISMIFWRQSKFNIFSFNSNQFDLKQNDNRKFPILLVKIFIVKPKGKSNTSSYYRKTKFCLFKKTVLCCFKLYTVKISNHTFNSTRDNMGTCETKTIQADLGTFTHILEYSAIISDIQKLFWHIRTYSEPSVTIVYSELLHIQYQKHKIKYQNVVKDNSDSNYLRKLKLLSQYQLFAFSTLWNEYHKFF